ncbi:MAG: response regulator, partial [Lachnospiraceae bacterium]|nr:response regulator [Lachnospiraceae bacterium]
MRVLIVEDHLRLAQSIQDILKQIWYDSDICTDGISGSYQLREGAYDAMILDLMLPGKDGITLLREAREQGCRIPVLILTAKSEVED